MSCPPCPMLENCWAAEVVNTVIQAQQTGYGGGYDSSYSGYGGGQQAYQATPQPAPVAQFAPQSQSGTMQAGSASYGSQMGSGGYGGPPAAPAPPAPAYAPQPSRVRLLMTAPCAVPLFEAPMRLCCNPVHGACSSLSMSDPPVILSSPHPG